MDAHPLRLRVQSTTAETPVVRGLVLTPEGGALPSWEAGAHIRISVPGGGDRPYSLMALPDLPKGCWALGVLREQLSAGGSSFMHALTIGDIVRASAPINNFGLHTGNTPAVLFAGGIGITPILSMAAELQARGTPYRLHYAGRAPESLAFLPQLRAICTDALSVHYDSDESRLGIATVLDRAPGDAHIYVCGPAGMIEAVKKGAVDKGIPAARIHYELFKAEPTVSADDAFEVELRSTGQVITVAPDQSIIDALERAGVELLYDCRRGDCGICQCGVILGTPDHRDVILSDEEKASNKVIQICVSRAKSERLVLDL
jgi:ferredoxin-NADP reductase